ncbi:hypothetical protein [Pectobacterium brasiliense]|uniref:hypothetical protein n=1 Tax=Pectobacterium brasiliense TaxID=180957 RepID=UPI000B95E6FE|nr:hypothetical protein [Pectobacterium brasiliense]OYN49616.1 hypothetical protein B7L51_20370 [Pectobacterium carotovorum]
MFSYYLNYFVDPLLLGVFAQLFFIFNIPFTSLTSLYPEDNQSDIIDILHNKKNAPVNNKTGAQQEEIK